MLDFSVIITHYRREENLRNTLNGLRCQTVPPTEVLIVEMGDGIEPLHDFPFETKIVPLNRTWRSMPLAAARNYGAECSSTGQLVFLDVDCIPSSEFCGKMTMACSRHRALVMGTPRYMLGKAEPGTEQEQLRNGSVFHPSRPVVNGLQKENCFELFWSLCFSIPKEVFMQMGGFDEGFEGYGAEDTDFALEVKKAGIPFYLSDAEVYHQQHPIYVPPLNHLGSIVDNANRFRLKWGYWPMADCLQAFAGMGFIEWCPTTNTSITIKNKPSVMQVGERLLKNAPYR